MSGDNQTKKRRKEKRKQKRDEATSPAVEVTPPPAPPPPVKTKVKKIKEKQDEPKVQEPGVGWVSKIEIFVMVAIVAGLVSFVAIEYRDEVESKISEFGIPEYFKNWIGESAPDQKQDESTFKTETTDHHHQEEAIVDMLRMTNESQEKENFARENDFSEELEAESLKEVNDEVLSEINFEENHEEEMFAPDSDDSEENQVESPAAVDDSSEEPHEEELQEKESQEEAPQDQPSLLSTSEEDFVEPLQVVEEIQSEESFSEETPEVVTKGKDLKNQVDELVDVYNDIAQMLGTDMVIEKPEVLSHDEPEIEASMEPDDNDLEADALNDSNEDTSDEDLTQQNEKLEEEPLSQHRGDQPPEEIPLYQDDSPDFHLDDFAEAENGSEESEVAENLDHYPEIKELFEYAKRLDVQAEKEKSNALLNDALAAYQDLLFNRGHKLNDTIFKEIADRSIQRMRFAGKLKAAVAVHKKLIERFDDEVDHRTQLAITYLLGNHLSVAKLVLHEILLRWPSNGLALVHYGFVLKQLDQDNENAVVYLREGIETFEPGTQDGRFYFNLGDALQRVGRSDEAREVYRKGAALGLFLSEYQRSLYNVDRLESRPFWTKVQTTYKDDLMEIQKYWQLIRDEGLKLLTKDGTFTNEAENLKDTGDWKQFELYARGMKSKQCSLAPITCKVIEKFTAASECKRGQVKFSVLHPNTHVHPHCGPTNCRIRCHLGLKVPENTFIRVGDTTKSWADGEWLIFDDSFEHEVWHNGTGTRLVLIVDVWHPDLTEDEKESLSGI